MLVVALRMDSNDLRASLGKNVIFWLNLVHKTDKNGHRLKFTLILVDFQYIKELIFDGYLSNNFSSTTQIDLSVAKSKHLQVDYISSGLAFNHVNRITTPEDGCD